MNGPAGHALLWILILCSVYEIVRWIRDHFGL